METLKRDYSVDALAGILIIYMILVHVFQLMGIYSGKLLYNMQFLNFYVPYFFYKSGMFFNKKSTAEVIRHGGVNIHLIGLKSPYCIWQYMIVVGIYYMGWLFSQYEGKLPQLNKVIWGGISMLFLGLLYFLTDFGFYGRLQPASINKESVVMLLLIALIGCGMIYALAKVLDMTLVGRIMAIVGDYSFSIMLLHFLSFKLINWIQCLVYDFPFDTISDFPFIKYDNILWFLLYVVAGTSLPIVASLSYHTLTERVRSRYRSI